MNMIAANNIIRQLPGIEIVKENVESILEITTANAYWKDKTGRYLGVNDVFVNVSGVTTYQDVVGKKDRDLIWDKQAPIIETNDQAIIHSGVSKTFIESALCSNDKKIKFFLSHKTPLKTSSGKIIGTFGLSFLLDDMHSLLPSIAQPIDVSFTPRQVDCLICLVKGKTIKQIAQSLNLSAKTVEHYLTAIKTKLGAQDRSEMIEKALQLTAIRERL